MSWDLLKRFIESDHFNNNPFLPVSYLSRYADHVGIHYVLCQKLRQFSYEEIEFFLPQLCHLIISVDNESMALEEFIIDLCEESVNAALLTFWLFQTYLYDLSGNPQSTTFRTCRRVYNKVQHIVFGVAEQSRKEKLKDNVLPVTVLASFVLAGVAAPFLPRWAGPLAIAQGRKPRSTGETISDPGQTQKIQRSHTVAGGSSRPRKDRTARSASGPNGSKATRTTTGRPKSTRPPLVVRSSSSHSNDRNQAESERPSLAVLTSLEARVSTISLPDMATSKATSTPSTPALSGSLQRSLHSNSRKLSHHTRPLTPSILSPQQRIKFLRSHYFRSETQFLTALEDISNRLVIVPKPARLSALRAELALIAQDLPAEVDIPIICPATLRDGSPGQSVHHRIVRLNPAEATVLNSAEKVPYLLMVEVLRDDFDFDPETAQNSQLLSQILSEGASRRRIFDLSEAPQHALKERVSNTEADSVFEPAQGDLGSSPLIKSLENEGTPRGSLEPGSVVVGSSSAFHPPPLSSSTHTLSTKSSLGTPRTSDMSKRSTSPGPLRSTTLSQGRNQTIDQPDVSALATHMRTAAHMLAQLDTSGSKRPKDEVAAIRAKIIASMQSLEEQSFYGDETSNGPTFDAIMASTNNSHMIEEPDAMNDNADAPTDPGLANNAGAARMENDQKTGGVQRQGDRDDPSAATFGEAWETKRERIRKASPYGWMKNWDLLSVIVKTGADLRQEAFASQLIQVCWKIWEDAEVPVWVKKMRILVTGESSGLIETITNGVSLHSLKRSLTLATIEAGKNPRGRIATLRDHFIKAFGEVDSETYKAGEDAFLRSLAAYSMISYILQLKDRHNGNILIDSHGHIIHIDFGFMLSNSPGSVGFEAAPFKLTQDYVDVLGGIESPKFAEFKKLCKVAFQALRKSADSIIDLVDMMGKDSKMPCFNGGAAQTTASLRQRFQLHLSKDDAEQFVETDLIGKSLGSYYTRLYDTFQYRTQGIY